MEMPERRSSNPFAPGPGARPPCLAGRVPERARWRERLDALVAGEPPKGGALVLFGPRGNGKTALLGLWRAEAQAAGVRVADLPGAAPTLAETVAAMEQRLEVFGQCAEEGIVVGAKLPGPFSQHGGAVGGIALTQAKQQGTVTIHGNLYAAALMPGALSRFAYCGAGC